jgi:hypothetical protein
MKAATAAEERLLLKLRCTRHRDLALVLRRLSGRRTGDGRLLELLCFSGYFKVPVMRLAREVYRWERQNK